MARIFRVAKKKQLTKTKSQAMNRADKSSLNALG
jgi:hypothetical protein